MIENQGGDEQDRTQRSIEVLWEHAVDICNLTRFWQPDFSLVLMHSAIGPLVAAEELWQIIWGEPCPNVIKSNLGREKTKDYSRRPRPWTTGWFVGEYEMSMGVSHFLAWLTYQENWLSQLRTQIEAVMGEIEPKRVLVIDDFIAEGSTEILVMGLLKTLWPRVEICFSAGSSRSEWKHINNFWLWKNFPGYERLEEKEKCALYLTLRHTMLDTEDIDQNDLGWKEIQSDSPMLDPLLPYGPPELWLSNSEWVISEVKKIIRKRAGEYKPKAPGEEIRKIPERYYGNLFCRDIWRDGFVSASDWQQRFGLTDAKMETLIGNVTLCDEVVPLDEDCYTIDPRDWMRMCDANIGRFSQYLDFTSPVESE